MIELNWHFSSSLAFSVKFNILNIEELLNLIFIGIISSTLSSQYLQLTDLLILLALKLEPQYYCPNALKKNNENINIIVVFLVENHVSILI